MNGAIQDAGLIGSRPHQVLGSFYPIVDSKRSGECEFRQPAVDTAGLMAGALLPPRCTRNDGLSAAKRHTPRNQNRLRTINRKSKGLRRRGSTCFAEAMIA